MEEELRNISISSTTTCQALPDPVFTAFVIVLAVTLVPVILLNGLVAIMLLRATSVAIQVRTHPSSKSFGGNSDCSCCMAMCSSLFIGTCSRICK